MEKRGTFLGVCVGILLGCGARSKIEDGDFTFSLQTGGSGGDTSMNATVDGGGRLVSLGGKSGSLSYPQGGVAGTTTSAPRTFLKKNFLVTASNQYVSKVFAASIDQDGVPSIWDVIPEGITNNTYFSASLSKGARRAVIQNNENASFLLAELDYHTTADLFAAGIDSTVPYVEMKGWFDDEHFMIDANPGFSTRPFERWFVQIDPATQKPYVSSKETSVTTGSISEDGKWITSTWVGTSSEKRFELASVGDFGVASVVVSEVRPKSDELWSSIAPNGRSAILNITDSNGVDSTAIYDLTTPVTAVKRISKSSSVYSWTYSPASNYLVGFHISDVLPIVTVATGASRTFPLSKGTQVKAISSSDEYAVLVNGSRISSLSLRNPDGTDTANPTENLLIDHRDDRAVDNLTSIREGQDVIYTLTNYSTINDEVFWFQVNSPATTVQNISKLLGASVGMNFSVAPSGDYVAIPSVDSSKMYLVLLAQPPKVQLIYLPPVDSQVSSFIDFAWAPDDSGLVVVRGGANSSVHYLPRQVERAKGFGELRSIDLPIAVPFEIELKMPKRWD